jgi:hypothetical protein
LVIIAGITAFVTTCFEVHSKEALACSLARHKYCIIEVFHTTGLCISWRAGLRENLKEKSLIKQKYSISGKRVTSIKKASD